MAIDTQGRQEVKFFVGEEVEHTICYGKKTLFVVGIQPVDEIQRLAEQHGCDHVYFGTSQSFNPQEISTEEYEPWDTMIKTFLELGYWVSLDFDVKHTEGVHESGYCEYPRFVPMISVKLPYINLFNYNATLKLDDITWGATNPGVWTHPLNSLMPVEKYTHWDQYTKDTEIK